MKNFKKVFVVVGTISLVGAVTTGLYLAINNNSSNIIQIQTGNVEETKGSKPSTAASSSGFTYFYPLNKDKYYKYIKIKNGKSYLDQEVVTAVLKKVMSNEILINGHLKYKYVFSDNNKIASIYFKWLSGDGTVFDHTYTISIN